ncbi:MAG: YlxR family protein [Dehalococcoidales bacterium]|nr:YlxR family protein [Dehalococcoidales bacterium]
MVRLVRTSTGEVEIDVTGKMEGRGTYLCRDRMCWEKVLKGQQLQHALKVKIETENLERLGEAGEKLLKESTIG